jgi:hypothetical protein
VTFLLGGITNSFNSIAHTIVVWRAGQRDDKDADLLPIGVN